MKNLVVAGGTSGMGRGLALHYLRQGARVSVVGTNEARGQAFLDEASALGGTDRAAFIQADLSGADSNRRVIDEVRSRHDALDGLVLSAIRQFPRRVETADGYDATFGLYYVSRFVLSFGLTDLLERGHDPIIVSIGGVGITKGTIHWDDLALRERYGMISAMLQAGRASDLLGVTYAERHPDGRTTFLLHHPGYTRSGTNHLRQPARALMRGLGALFAQPIERAIAPIIELIDKHPAGRLLAYDRRAPVSTDLPTLDPTNARRLYGVTRGLLEG